MSARFESQTREAGLLFEYLSQAGPARSPSIIPDRVAGADGPERLPGRKVDVVRNEVDRAVAEDRIDTTRVSAAREGRADPTAVAAANSLARPVDLRPAPAVAFELVWIGA